jgi:hypothetical protein
MDKLINQKFGRLTILDIFFKEKNGIKRKYAKCICDCSKIIESRLDALKYGDTVSCGCYKIENNKKLYKIDLVNKKFGKLLVLEEASKINNRYCAYKCKCDCGNEKIIIASSLKNGATTSCGCGNLETRFKRINEPILTSIKCIFKNYSDGDLTIDNFIELTKKNCFYCNEKPNNYFNISKFSYTKFDSEFDFNYNGLDRLDNSKGHYLNNVVTCCKVCNRAKNKLNYKDFLIQVKKIYENCIINFRYRILENELNNLIKAYLLISPDPNKKSLIFCNSFYSNYRKNSNLTLKDFAKLTKFNCFYCNASPNNGSEYKYSGLDRVDNNKPHNIDNVIPCCFNCNLFKTNKTLNEFIEHVTKIYNYLNLKQSIL